ncbi:hydrophobic surface binding protein [Mycena pura]|uniref:Hydrophobic surface binding protein n=1 Tax=Mycena pura TaxID=153505 RepID=A0AAD6Y401_9AGAR|nr:hydrophobic surface binding protein [Mycena pura]
MVQVTFSLAIISIAAAGLTRAAVLKRDAATIEADLGVLASQAATLDNAINAFPLTGGSVDDALAIHTDATTLISAVNTATGDAQAAGTLSEADGRAILAGTPSLEPLLGALQGVVAKKPAFDALPISDIDAIILQDLETLQSSLDAFGDALVNDFPADLVAEATELKDSIDNAFAPAIAAYSS